MTILCPFCSINEMEETEAMCSLCLDFAMNHPHDCKCQGCSIREILITKAEQKRTKSDVGGFGT